ncbi:MAG TPA: FkbM family methyltransferase [Chloroflexia bacterium]|nr:FkbM family methyltransferase [Chloroflexia bacterium]
MLGRLKRLLRAGRATRLELRHDWRTVRSGPLQGLSFYLPSGEEAPWADRFLTGKYEPEMLAALQSLARKGGTLYDIGAHIGFYTCAWLKLGGQSVEAFEPAPYNREILEATLERNNLARNVRVHSVALGSRDGEATLLASRKDVGASSAAYLRQTGGVGLMPEAESGSVPGVESINVPLRKLDTVCAELELPAPSVIKLDIEGAEAAALAGGQSLLTRCRPAILCEVHTVSAALSIAARLAQQDYRLVELGNNTPHPACLWLPPGLQVALDGE